MKVMSDFIFNCNSKVYGQYKVESISKVLPYFLSTRTIADSITMNTGLTIK